MKKAKGEIPAYYASREWLALRGEVLKRDGKVCHYCGEKATTADHVIPRRKGGADSLANLVACCMTCNAVAGGKMFISLEKKRVWVVRERERLTRTPVRQKARGSRAIKALGKKRRKDRVEFDQDHYVRTMHELRRLELERRRGLTPLSSPQDDGLGDPGERSSASGGEPARGPGLMQ